MSVGLILQVLIVGVAAGAVYALVAVGFALVYRLTSVLQFAHGQVIAASSFIAILIAVGTGPVTASNVSVARYLSGLAVAIVGGAALAAILYTFAVRPFIARASTIGWIGGTLAVAFAIDGALAAIFPREAYVLPDPLPFSRWKPISLPNGAALPLRTLWILGVATAVALAARALLRHSTFGVAVSAVASEPAGARLVGLPVERLVAIAFALSGGLAAIAGVIGTPGGGTVSARAGAVLGLKGLAAALLGGMENTDAIFGAAIGIGVLESAVTTLHVPGVPHLALGPAWHDLAPLVLVVVLLAVRAPRGAQDVYE